MMYDPYAVLGVKYDATDEEVKKAYRQKSRLYHPDANINNPNKAQAEEKFKQVQQAYDQIMKEREQGARGGYGSGTQYGPGSSYYNGGNPYGSQYGGSQYDGDAQNAYNNEYQDPFGGNGFFYGPFGFGFHFGGNAQQNAYQQQSTARDPRMAGVSEEEASHLQAAVNFINAGHYQEAWNLLQTIQTRTAFWYYLAAVVNSGLGNNINALEYARQAVQREPNNEEYLQLLQRLQSGGSWYENRSTDYGRSLFSGSICGRACVTYALCTLCSGGMGRFFCCY